LFGLVIVWLFQKRFKKQQNLEQGKRIWKLRGFSVTVVESFTARSLLHYWRTLYGYACACLVSGAFCHVD
jgi:hypothetical protein